MIISLEWLQEFTPVEANPQHIEDLLTRAGMKVEAIHSSGGDYPNVVVGEILSSEQHPNADRLSVCSVEDGSGEPRQIVCGAKNYRVGDKVPLALPGAVLPGNFKIKSGKLRGVASEGMMCSGKELGMSPDSDGLLILPADVKPGTPIGELYPANHTLELEITPNRPDWLSHIGVARELACFSGHPWIEPSFQDAVVTSDGPVTLQDDAACRFYSLRRIQGVKVGPSPDWLRRRLEACGLRSINNIVDITNYILLETGQPLHAFDAAMTGGGMTIRPATVGEKFTALDGSEHALEITDTVIAGPAGALALGGVMGGASSGVTEQTTEVWLESAWFEPAAIRKTSHRLGLHTDSSYRFERGVDPQMVLAASSRATELILELAGGEASRSVVAVGDLPKPGATLELDHARARQLLALPLPDEEIDRVLTSIGCKNHGSSEGASRWAPPSWRADLQRPVDLAEELIRCIGIERVESKLYAAPAMRSQADSFYDFSLALREALKVEGFCEARTSTLISSAHASLEKGGSACLQLKNPLGTEQAVLRPSLLPGLLEVARRNFHHGARDARLFEIGRTFHSGEPEERFQIAFVVSSLLQPLHWGRKDSGIYGFFDLKGLLQRLFGGKLAWAATSSEKFAVAASLGFGGQNVGTLGILAPALARELDAPFPVVAAEIRLLPDMWQSSPALTEPLSKFPTVRRDLAVVLPSDSPFQNLVEAIQQLRIETLLSIEPFDLFRDPEGVKLPADRKSTAISLTFQSADRTLESSEIEKHLLQIQDHLEKQLGAKIRQ